MKVKDVASSEKVAKLAIQASPEPREIPALGIVVALLLAFLGAWDLQLRIVNEGITLTAIAKDLPP